MQKVVDLTSATPELCLLRSLLEISLELTYHSKLWVPQNIKDNLCCLWVALLLGPCTIHKVVDLTTATPELCVPRSSLETSLDTLAKFCTANWEVRVEYTLVHIKQS